VPEVVKASRLAVKPHPYAARCPGCAKYVSWQPLFCWDCRAEDPHFLEYLESEMVYVRREAARDLEEEGYE
jgi:hypothetical protein